MEVKVPGPTNTLMLAVCLLIGCVHSLSKNAASATFQELCPVS